MCAILASYPELMDMVKRLFVCCQRALRFYLFNDVDQVDPFQISHEVAQAKDSIVQNSFGVVVQDFSGHDFKSRRILDEAKYVPEESRSRIIRQENLVFGQMINFVQYFADIGGFDAILNLMRLGTQPPEESKEDKQDYSS
jgi:predicted Zn-dependent protease